MKLYAVISFDHDIEYGYDPSCVGVFKDKKQAQELAKNAERKHEEIIDDLMDYMINTLKITDDHDFSFGQLYIEGRIDDIQEYIKDGKLKKLNPRVNENSMSLNIYDPTDFSAVYDKSYVVQEINITDIKWAI